MGLPKESKTRQVALLRCPRKRPAQPRNKRKEYRKHFCGQNGIDIFDVYERERERERKGEEREKGILVNVELERRRDSALSERRQTASHTMGSGTKRDGQRTGFIQPPFKNSGTARCSWKNNQRARGQC